MSNEIKLTAVDFLIKQKEKWGTIILDDLRIAKKMEKEQIIKAIDSNYTYNDNQILTIGEQYYNETYGGNK
jgi:hypothetical protein